MFSWWFYMPDHPTQSDQGILSSSICSLQYSHWPCKRLRTRKTLIGQYEFVLADQCLCCPHMDCVPFSHVTIIYFPVWNQKKKNVINWYTCTPRKGRSLTKSHVHPTLLAVGKGSLLLVFRIITVITLLEQTSLRKQCRPRSDATERGVWSGSTLFATRPAIL